MSARARAMRKYYRFFHVRKLWSSPSIFGYTLGYKMSRTGPGRFRFLYRVIRNSPGVGNGEKSPSPRTTAQVYTARHLYSVIRGIKGVIFDMDGTLTIPVLNFTEMRTRLGLSQGIDILPAVMRMPAADQDRAMKIIQELEEEGTQLLRLIVNFYVS